jgi:predicted homoserine dehydrogenase-like protein
MAGALRPPRGRGNDDRQADLTPGERLDDFGGYAYYGTIERAEIARTLNALPVGLAPGARVTRVVPAGEIVTWAAVQLDEESVVVKLRRQQDEMALNVKRYLTSSPMPLG